MNSSLRSVIALASILANPYLMRPSDREPERPEVLPEAPPPEPTKPATLPEVEAYRADRARRKRENWLKRQPKGKH